MTDPGGSGPDPIGDFQRWLLRAGARGMSRQLADQVRTAIGRNQPRGDVWETATSEPPPGEAPECAWCPLCRAARLVREAKPGRDTRVAAVGDALTTVVQDAVSVLEAALTATGRGTGSNGRRDEAGPGTRGFPAAGQAAQARPGGKAAQARPGGKAAQAQPGGKAAQAQPSGKAAPAESAGEAASAQSAGEAAPAESAGQAPGGQAGPVAQAAPGPASGPDGSGPAAAAGEQAAPESPEEPPHEPDDRG